MEWRWCEWGWERMRVGEVVVVRVWRGVVKKREEGGVWDGERWWVGWVEEGWCAGGSEC